MPLGLLVTSGVLADAHAGQAGSRQGLKWVEACFPTCFVFVFVFVFVFTIYLFILTFKFVLLYQVLVTACGV